METTASQTCGNCGLSTKLDGSLLSRCGKCRTQLYCGPECQKEHWATHKLTCKKSTENASNQQDPVTVSLGSLKVQNGTVVAGPAIMIEPLKMTQAEGGYGFAYWAQTNMSFWENALEHHLFKIPVADILGTPFGLMNATAHGDVNAPNEQIKALGLDPDPDSTYFGQSRWAPAPTGTAIVMRNDLQAVHINQVAALAGYCCMVLDEAAKLAKREAKGEKADKHELAARLLTPQAFKKFFYDLKKKEEATDESWEGCECPVTLK